MKFLTRLKQLIGFGLMCDMQTLRDLCDRNKIFLVEDACHAPTATLNEIPSGSFGDVSTFSFHATKHISSGEGGVICTNSEDEYQSLQTLRSHGLPHWSKRTGYGYDINEVAFNYRPNEISASLAYSHLLRIDDLVKNRRKIAKIYDSEIDFNYYRKQYIPKGYTHVYHLYPILVPEINLRDKFLTFLKDSNIFGQIHYPPINKMTGFRKFNYENKISEDISARIVSIPMYPQLTDGEIGFVIDKINEFSSKN